MSTISRDSFYYRNVPPEWEPLRGFTGAYFWRRLPRRGNHIGAEVPDQLWYPVWRGPPNDGRWLHYVQSLHAKKSGPGRKHPDYPGTMRGPWGVVDYYEAPTGSTLSQAEGLVTDVFAAALGAIARIFPAKYRQAVELALTAVAAAWTAGALSGLILQAMPALEPVLAKKIAGRLVGDVLSPRAVLGALAAPPAPPDMDIGALVSSLMRPLDAMAARSTKGDPADGVGNAFAATTAAVVSAGANATAKQTRDLSIAGTAVTQLQTNLAILITLAFENALHASLWDVTPVKFYGGWTPDQWFSWVQSLPLVLSFTPQAQRVYRKRGRWYGVQDFSITECKLCVSDGIAHLWARTQGAPTARRDCLRVYFRAAGIPTRAADWAQQMIDASPAARTKAKNGGTIVELVMLATTDAVHASVAAHARKIAPAEPAVSTAKASVPVSTAKASVPVSTAKASVPVSTAKASVPATVAHKGRALATVGIGATLLLKALSVLGV